MSGPTVGHIAGTPSQSASADLRLLTIADLPRWQDDVVTDLVRVHASSDVLSAELVRGRLEAEGVFAEIKGEGAGPYRVGQVYLWVPQEDEDAAREILAAVEAGSYLLSDADQDLSP
jgi:Putative prokaryotic signal transducing protein